MEAWKEKLDAWSERLAQWDRGFAEHYRRLARERKRLLRPLSTTEKDEIAAAARKLAGEETAVELFAFLSELYDAYLAEPLPQNRAKARAWIGASPPLLNANWNYATQAPELVRGPQAAAILARGLAAVSLDDVRTDYQEVLDALARLWLAARKNGLDPKPQFERVAAASNPGMGGGGAFMAKTMREFDTSAFFRDHVRPRLPRASA